MYLLPRTKNCWFSIFEKKSESNNHGSGVRKKIRVEEPPGFMKEP
jgi:hypothetical protein